VLDEWGRPCPPGTTGQLILGGVGIAEGYLGRPELTARSFRSGIPGVTAERVYDTGDRAHWGTDGLLYLHGRRDGQVKVRGHRVELGEVESVLRAVPGVADVAVVPYTVGGAHTGLAAFVVPAAGAPPEPAPVPAGLREQIRARLATELPEYLRPQVLHAIGGLPRLSSGKLDRARLSDAVAVDGAGPDPDTTAEPLGPLHAQVKQIWAEILGVSGVPVGVDFFRVGGDSLSAARVVAKVKTRLGVPVTLPQFLADPTLDGIARLVEAHRAANCPAGAAR